MVYLLIVLLGLAIIIPIVSFSVYYGISPMPSSRRAIEAMKSLVPPDFEGIFYDLGSGFGTLSFAFARHFPKSTVTGFEISPYPFLIAKLFFRRKNLRFLRKDFFTVDLARADYLLCYLYPGAMQKLQKYSYNRLISNSFSFYDRKAEGIIKVDDFYKTIVYFYS